MGSGHFRGLLFLFILMFSAVGRAQMITFVPTAGGVAGSGCSGICPGGNVCVRPDSPNSLVTFQTTFTNRTSTTQAFTSIVFDSLIAIAAPLNTRPTMSVTPPAGVVCASPWGGLRVTCTGFSLPAGQSTTFIVVVTPGAGGYSQDPASGTSSAIAVDVRVGGRPAPAVCASINPNAVPVSQVDTVSGWSLIGITIGLAAAALLMLRNQGSF